MADYNLGTAKGRIRTEYDNSGAVKAQKSFKDIAKSTDDMHDGFKKVAQTSGVATLALASGLVLAANKAIDFQKQISGIGAVSGASSDQLESLRKKALQLGADTVFSASDAAGAMEELAKAGVGVEDILNGAADAAVNLAAAGGIDLAQAAEIAANAMGQFNIKASGLAHVVDEIAGAANASAISVNDFNESMKQVGAVAHLAGAGFDDVAVAIAEMGRAGIKGSDAGTSLKTMLLNLQPSTKKQTELFQKLGLVTKEGSNQFFDARGNLKSLADVSGVLQNALKGMTAQQKQFTLEMLFGTDAIRAAAVLTNNGAKGFNAMADAMGKVKAADVAAARLDNVAGSIEQLKGSLETGAISIGTALLPAIRKLTDLLTGLVNKFNALTPTQQKFIAFALVAATALAALVTAVAAIGFAITGIASALAVVASGGIVAAVVAGILAIVAAFVILWKRSEAFRVAVGGIFAVISDHVKQMRTVIQPFINFIRNELIPILANGFKKAIDNLKPAFLAINEFMREKMEPALRQFREALTTAMPTIIKVARVIGQTLATQFAFFGRVLGIVIPLLLKVIGFILPAVIALISFLIRNIPTFVSMLKTTFSILAAVGKGIATAIVVPFYAIYKAGVFVFNAIMVIVKGFLAFWSGVWSVIGPVVKAAFGLVWSIISTIMTAVGAIIQVVWTLISTAFRNGANLISGIVSGVFNFISGIITSVLGFLAPYIKAIWDFISGVINFALGEISNYISGTFNTIKGVISVVWTGIKNATATVWAFISNLIQKAVTNITGYINSIKSIVDKIKAFFGQLKDAASGGVSSLLSFVAGIPGRILSALGNIGSLLYDKGKAIVQGLIDGIKSQISKLKDAMGNLLGIVGRFLPGSPAKEGPLSGQGYTKIRGAHLTEDFAAGIDSQASEVQAAVASMIAALASTLPNPANRGLVAGTATAQGAPGLVSVTLPDGAKRGSDGGDINIDKIELNGFIDWSDPLVVRKVAAKLDEVLKTYQKSFK